MVNLAVKCKWKRLCTLSWFSQFSFDFDAYLCIILCSLILLWNYVQYRRHASKHLISLLHDWTNNHSFINISTRIYNNLHSSNCSYCVGSYDFHEKKAKRFSARNKRMFTDPLGNKVAFFIVVCDIHQFSWGLLCWNTVAFFLEGGLGIRTLAALLRRVFLWEENVKN